MLWLGAILASAKPVEVDFLLAFMRDGISSPMSVSRVWIHPGLSGETVILSDEEKEEMVRERDGALASDNFRLEGSGCDELLGCSSSASSLRSIRRFAYGL